jgi:hypothetical protein
MMNLTFRRRVPRFFFTSTVLVCHGSTHSIEVDITEVRIYGIQGRLSKSPELSIPAQFGEGHGPLVVQFRCELQNVPELSSHRPNQSDSLRHSQSERPFDLNFLKKPSLHVSNYIELYRRCP